MRFIVTSAYIILSLFAVGVIPLPVGIDDKKTSLFSRDSKFDVSRKSLSSMVFRQISNNFTEYKTFLVGKDLQGIDAGVIFREARKRQIPIIYISYDESYSNTSMKLPEPSHDLKHFSGTVYSRVTAMLVVQLSQIARSETYLVRHIHDLEMWGTFPKERGFRFWVNIADDKNILKAEYRPFCQPAIEKSHDETHIVLEPWSTRSLLAKPQTRDALGIYREFIRIVLLIPHIAFPHEPEPARPLIQTYNNAPTHEQSGEESRPNKRIRPGGPSIPNSDDAPESDSEEGERTKKRIRLN
ncbi:hypothetical protein EV360DRAFT_76606 [Lentinula raphanica]|nr:hypothetical protein EV360DRAFT_76606 [Lentinula raphanica]